jgi:predicted DsbA family dithiol-disulfide isomerase
MSSLRILDVDSPDPVRDGDGALVLDWWCDLQCPDCRDGLEILDALQDRFGDRLVLRLRHFPLTNHVWAVAAAVCQVAAAEQGRGEDYTAHALGAIDEIDGPADYVDLAEHLGLDADAVAEAMLDGTLAATVRDDYEQGRALGVLSTPTYVVDGLLVDASRTLDGAQDALTERIAAALAR